MSLDTNGLIVESCANIFARIDNNNKKGDTTITTINGHPKKYLELTSDMFFKIFQKNRKLATHLKFIKKIY
jgi:hypothetical protein